MSRFGKRRRERGRSSREKVSSGKKEDASSEKRAAAPSPLISLSLIFLFVSSFPTPNLSPPPSQQVRADLNVPLDKDLKITDDTRIRAAIPTLKYLVDNGAKVLLTSHLGRPKDGPEDKFRLNPVVPRLQELLKGTKVSKVDDCIGDSVAAAAKALGNGKSASIFLLLEVRGDREER